MRHQPTITEKRFREGTGEKYTKIGDVRCQAQSKYKLRKWRNANNDFITPNEDIWPQCQCHYTAIPGTFACNFHGGLTPGRNKPRSLLESMPIDLADKVKTLLENPDYMSSHEDIVVLKARQWQIMEDMDELSGSKEAWQLVKRAHEELSKGELALANSMLEEAIDNQDSRARLWDEYLTTNNAVQGLRNTEVKVAKELRMMATAEQVIALLQNIYSALVYGTEKYIHDPRQQSDFLRYIAGEIGRFANIGPIAISAQLRPGSKSES